MVDISVRMLEFKEAVRHNWNSYFAFGHNPMSPETQDAFSDIERALLQVLVLAEHGMGDIANSYRKRILHEIVISLEPGELSIRYGARDSNGNRVWDEETTLAEDRENMRFYFYDFFDWYPYGQVDLPFVRLKVHASSTDETGRMALVEQRYCKFALVTDALEK